MERIAEPGSWLSLSQWKQELPIHGCTLKEGCMVDMVDVPMMCSHRAFCLL